jgi:hypothetical protein
MNHVIAGTVVEPQGNGGTANIPVKQQMNAFMSKLDADVEQSRRMLVTAEARLVEQKNMCAAFPSTLPMAPRDIAITPGNYKAEAELVFEVTTRDEVMQLLDAFPGVPVVMLRAGCTSFMAEERVTEVETGTTVVPIGEVVYRLANWVANAQEEYIWWTHLDGKLVHVLARTKKGHAVCAKVTSSTRTLGPNSYEATYYYENLPDGVITTWFGGSSRDMVPVSVHQPRGRGFRDAVTKPMSASAKASSRTCDC